MQIWFILTPHTYQVKVSVRIIQTFIIFSKVQPTIQIGAKKIDRNYKHIPLKRDGKCTWTDKDNITVEFVKLIEKYQNSKIVISYRKDGILSIEKLHEIRYCL